MSIYRGIRHQCISAVAGVIAFGIFALSSYPFQLPAMVIMLLFLLTVCQVPEKGEKQVSIPQWRHVSFCAVWVVSALLFFRCTVGVNQSVLPACRKWNTAHMLYTAQCYQEGERKYDELYCYLHNRPGFVFEYAMCLRHLEKYEQSNLLLERALCLSGEPMILNVMGRNYMDLALHGSGKRFYEQSEFCLQKSLHRLPGRLYPYYLLAKLYICPEYYYPEKAREMAVIVLTRKEKVKSYAVREMRREMKKIIE